MDKFINIDENTRIMAIPMNYALQYKIKSKKHGTRWITDGYFANIGQCAIEALNNSPALAITATSDLKRVIEVLEQAEKKILKVIK
jgi:hypothetical protein